MTTRDTWSSEWMPTPADDVTRRALLGIVDAIEPVHGELCGRCGHARDSHRLNDATNVSPTDPSAVFRCSRGIATVRLCDCPNYVAGNETTRLRAEAEA